MMTLDFINGTKPAAEPIFNTQIFIAVLAALVTIAGWIVSNYLGKKTENETKLLQLKLDHISRQIEELYGPLFNIVYQVNLYYNNKQNIIEKGGLTDSDKNNVNVYVREQIFYPLHTEIRTLIKEKYHLIDNNELPESFRDYLDHSTQETLQIDIWEKLRIDTSKVEGIRWPDKFDREVKASLDRLKTEYSQLLEALN